MATGMAHPHPNLPSASLDNLPLCAPNSRIPVTTYCTILDVFESRLYDIWPIVDVQYLRCQLQARVNDPTSLALAAAACAATVAQMRLWITPDSCLDDLPVAAEDFTKECLRIRLEYHYHQEPSLQALVTSIFLHMFYANRDQITPATISLREAITYADLMRLSHSPPADAAQSKQWQLELRCYWILFVTERSARRPLGSIEWSHTNLHTLFSVFCRTFCIQHDLPITLHRTPSLPEIEISPDSQGDLYAGFRALVQLFLHVQRPLALPGAVSRASETPVMYSKDSITRIQRHMEVQSPGLEFISEIQYVDILTTSAWVRSLLWQYSASRFMLSSSTSTGPLTFDYPLSIAKNYLESLADVSIESLRSHGYGMVNHFRSLNLDRIIMVNEDTETAWKQEIKLLQVANSVLDIVLCMPKLLSHQTSHFGPLDAVVAIERLLSQVGGVKSERLCVLHQRFSQVPSSITTSLILELPDQEDGLDEFAT
ncbi:uncharacterized protein N7458_011275 [Penicillium daleae]|uniref:Transcription factor domain-containing protein n=1 Tax=Penicillium daleae TaxID=63821 RepID=A0AAD6FWW9_9EURO|nr:uncharacterized protein N7458_011275 [Penicillium daleae]KAJ5432119.1 hypothetical protein N7458_011275 [Penicillium daleae]